jgi:hypothetical protein
MNPQSRHRHGLCCARDPWAKPATDNISVERNFTEVCVFARPLAKLPAPPTMRHHAETSATMIADLMLADLRLSHHTLAQQFDGVSLRSGIRCGEAAVWLFAAIDLLLRAMFRGRCAFRPDRQKSWLGARPKGNMVRNPDALGLSTRLGAERSRGSAHARHGQSHRRRLYGPARRFSDSMVAQTVGRAHDEQAYAHA